MVFHDSAGAIGNGQDIMASSVGKIQIGRQSTDVTNFVGEVNVPDPTKDTHAVTTKQYSDNSTAMSMAMASALNSQHEGHHFGIGFSEFGGQTATAIGLSYLTLRKEILILPSRRLTLWKSLPILAVLLLIFDYVFLLTHKTFCSHLPYDIRNISISRFNKIFIPVQNFIILLYGQRMLLMKLYAGYILGMDTIYSGHLSELQHMSARGC